MQEEAMATVTLSPTLTPVLERVSPGSQGIDETCLARLYARIEAHITAGWYPGAAIAMARHGKLVATRSFGVARLATTSTPAVPATEQSLWLLYSQIEPVTTSVLWTLFYRDRLRVTAV